MHEYSMMTQIVDSILAEAKRRNATKIEEVDLEIGEYTLLGEEQMRFAFELMTRDTILNGAKLNIRSIPGKIKCHNCGYEGAMTVNEDSPHRIVPILSCPRCNGVAEITEGRGCLVRNIRMVVPDV